MQPSFGLPKILWIDRQCADLRATPQWDLRASEQARVVVDEDAFEREHALLGLGATGRGKSAQFAAGREHAMARNDQRYRIARHGDADILRGLRLRRASALGELAIRHGFAEADLAQRVVDQAAERIDAREVEPDRRK